jgi:hypothetical protein
VRRVILIIFLLILLVASTIALPQSKKNPWKFNSPFVDWGEDTVMNLIFKDLQSNNCSVCSNECGETGPEFCPCPNGELCLDIFVASKAWESDPLWPTAKVDHCVDRTHVAESYIKCDILSATYFVTLECPHGFICVEGQCEHNLNTSIGPAANLSFDDNGTLISANNITINGLTIDDPRMVVIGPNSSIAYAESLSINGTLLSKIVNLTVNDDLSVSFARSLAGNLSFGKATDAIILANSTLVMRSGKNASHFFVKNPFDDSTLEFFLDPHAEVTFNLTDSSLAIKGTGYIMRVGLDIPEPPFIHFAGDLSNLVVIKSPGHTRYNYSSGNLTFDSKRYRELIIGAADVSLSYQSGVRCANMTRNTSYRYLDFMDPNRSLALTNKHQPDYTVCVQKTLDPIDEPKDALYGLTTYSLNLTGAIVHLRLNATEFKPVYETIDSNTALLDLVKGTESVHNPLFGLITKSSTAFYSILEFESNRYVSVHPEALPTYLSLYDASDEPAVVRADGDMLVQVAGGGNVTFFGPYTARAERYASTLLAKKFI